MTDDTGSRWYFPVYEGLFDAKHVEAMGPALWLYGWILGRAWAAQNGGVLQYNHHEAAEELGVDARQIRRWFRRLQENSYLITRARKPYGLEVEVSNWRRIEEWRSDRERTKMSYLGEREDKREDKREDIFAHAPITIRLIGYEYPYGSQSDGTLTLSGAFAGFLEQLKTSSNKQALLRQLYELCFTGEPPDYGYLGRVAKAVGGAGRLAEIMWQLSTKPPTGDIMAYIQAAYGPKSRGNGKNHSARAPTVDWDAVAADEMRKWKAEQHEQDNGAVD